MRNSFEINNNNNKAYRKQNSGKNIYSHMKSSLNKKSTKSMNYFIEYTKAKKDFEKLKKIIKREYYSNAKLNIINILNNCINEDFYSDFSFDKRHKSNLNDVNENFHKLKVKKIKKQKINSRISKTNNDFNHINLSSDKSISNKKFKNLTSFENKPFNNIKQEKPNNIFHEKEKSEIKNINNINKLTNDNDKKRKSVNVSCRSTLTKIKNKYKHIYQQRKNFY